jgi:hypothetical protein
MMSKNLKSESHGIIIKKGNTTKREVSDNIDIV